MATDIFNNPAVFNNPVTFADTVNLKPGSIKNADIVASAGITQDKFQHAFHVCYSASGTAAAATIPVFICNGATGVLKAVKAATIVACIGNAKITVDVKKNGTSVLTATFDLDSGNTARVSESGTLSGGTTALVAGDLLEVVIAVDAGTGTLGTGLIVDLDVYEDAA